MRLTGEGDAVDKLGVSLIAVFPLIGLIVTVSPGGWFIDSPVEQDPIKKEGINKIKAIIRKDFGCFNIVYGFMVVLDTAVGTIGIPVGSLVLLGRAVGGGKVSVGVGVNVLVGAGVSVG